MKTLLLLLASLLATASAQEPAASQPAAADTKPAAAAEAQVEGYLFFASNDANAPAQDEKDKVNADAAVVKDLSDRLGKVFKFSHFHLIGRHQQKVFKEYESWVVPSKDLCLRIDSKGPAEGGGIHLNLQLWQDTRVLVKSDTTIRKERPVFLGGPDWRGGRLIFVVVLK